MDGVILTPLKQIFHPKGNVFHAMKSSEHTFTSFGEAYFSVVNQNAIKGWKKHTKMTLNLVVIVGEIEFVIYDESKQEFFTARLSKNNYKRLTVSKGLWMAFRGIKEHNILLNMADLEHDPNESINKELDEIVYEW